MNEKDTYGGLVPMIQNGWEYVRPFRSGTKNFLLAYDNRGGQYANNLYKARIISGLNSLNYDKDNNAVSYNIEDFTTRVKEVSTDELENLLEKYMYENNYNVLKVHCPKKPGDILLEAYQNDAYVRLAFRNWAYQTQKDIAAGKREQPLFPRPPVRSPALPTALAPKANS
jgi:hypothetical protein